MNKLFYLLLMVSGISQADATLPQELVIQHLPSNIEIIKQCANATQRQSTQIVSGAMGSSVYSSSSAISISSSSTAVNDEESKDAKLAYNCTLIIRTVKPCLNAACRQTIDFYPSAVATAPKNSKGVQ